MAMLHTSPQPTGTLCLVLLLILSLDFLPTGAENPHEKIRRCGRNLIDTLKKACNHNYIQPDQAQFQGTYYRTLVRAKRSARRSITHDCCANKCSLQYIQNTYCGAPPSQDDHYTGRSDSYHLSHGVAPNRLAKPLLPDVFHCKVQSQPNDEDI